MIAKIVWVHLFMSDISLSVFLSMFLAICLTDFLSHSFTYTLCPPFSLYYKTFVYLFMDDTFSLFLSFSLSHSFNCTHTHTHTHTRARARSLAISLSLYISISLSFFLTLMKRLLGMYLSVMQFNPFQK